MTIRNALLIQSEACDGLGSPFMGRLMAGLAQNWPDDSVIGRLCSQWEGDIGPSAASLPLRLAGGLHALVLNGEDADLQSVYPPKTTDDEILIAKVLDAMERHSTFLVDWMQSAPQTNEVRRSAVMIAAAQQLATRFDLPFVTSELGASAGLNLNWDHFALETDQGRLGPDAAALTLNPTWRGAFPAPGPVHVAERAGVDLNPLDPSRAEDAQRLLAYLWPDQPFRADLTRAAIAIQRTEVAKSDAIDWLQTRLSSVPQGHIHLIYHTIAWQYFPAQAQARGTKMIQAQGARATSDTPLAWLQYEADGHSPGAGIVLRLWPGDLVIPLGRADFHGRWVDWTAG
ncbi:MAG: DUF2332 domain-containing protein [Sedimentitalea sp.]